MKLLVLIADPDEFRPLVGALKTYGAKEEVFCSLPSASCLVGNHKLFLLCSYIGKVNAACACALALAREGFDGVLNIGYSGAVSGLLKNDVVAGTSYTECDFDLTPIGYLPGEKLKGKPYIFEAHKTLLAAAEKSIPGIKTGKLGTGDFFLTDPVKRERYRELFEICAFDMESGAIASVCHTLDVPFLSIRKISDDADDTASSAYREALGSAEKALSDILLPLVKSI